ncbi:MAG TPA: glycosyltransferase family 2 protein [Acidobacteriota bacterium]|nr:glycosyltransferase family 2 protein [Acidobacteriota bacterium]
MKLIIQIPCYNEEANLPQTIHDLPREIDGVDAVEFLIIDDGSRDETREVARSLGVHHIISFPNRRGLAFAFGAGLNAALSLGADIIVNTDADNQYNASDIQNLIDPILKGKADVVIGDRNVETIEHFSFLKRKLQRFGSWVVRQVSGTKIPDATSGFRAYSREAAMRINVLTDFTYTLETIISAGKKRMAIQHIPVRTNPQVRPSRLFTSMWDYIKKSIVTIIRIYTHYEPLKMFFYIGAIVFLVGSAIGVRFLYYYFFGNSQGHIQSLILSAVLLIAGLQIVLIGLVSDLIFGNRKILEEILYRQKKLEFGQSAGRSQQNADDEIHQVVSRIPDQHS